MGKQLQKFERIHDAGAPREVREALKKPTAEAAATSAASARATDAATVTTVTTAATATG